jgi:hypothetical protein
MRVIGGELHFPVSASEMWMIFPAGIQPSQSLE